MAKDLVCGMDVDEKTAQYTAKYKGITYYFCAPGCKNTFEDNPEEFIGGSSGQHCCCGGH